MSNGARKEKELRNRISEMAKLASNTVPRRTCFYCGDTADTRDHLLPRPWRGDVPGPTIPACRSCNSTLGEIFMPDPWDRRTFVQERLATKHARLLDGAWMTREELHEQGYVLRLMSANTIIKRHAMYQRVSFPEQSKATATRRARDSLMAALEIVGE